MAYKKNNLLVFAIILSAIALVIALVGFGRFANDTASGENLYKRKEYGPHFLTGSLCALNIILMSVHAAIGRKTLGLICCVIGLFSLFAGGVSFDKDAHTIATGWREPGRPATYSNPVNNDPFNGNRWPKCGATVTFDKVKTGKEAKEAEEAGEAPPVIEDFTVSFENACENIKLSFSGNIIYAFATLIALYAIPNVMKSPIRPERNRLMISAMVIIFIGFIIYSVGFYIFIEKYDKVKSFGNSGEPRFITAAKLYEREEFSSMIVFAAVVIVMWLVALYCISNVSYFSMYVCAVASMIGTYVGGMAFGYSGRLVHAGFRTNFQIWGPPYGEKGPLDCEYNADVSDACRLMAATAAGAAIVLFGIVLLYLACYFAITGDLIFGQLNAQAWYNGQMWLTSYPNKKMEVVPSNRNASDGVMWVNPQPDPAQGAAADARA